MIRVAHDVSSAAEAGRHTKTRLRLGEALTPVTLYGPSIIAVRIFGIPPTMWISWLSRREGSHTSWGCAGRSRHVKPTLCGPAVTLTRVVIRASMTGCHS